MHRGGRTGDDLQAVPDRTALVGAMIAAVFGVLWVAWGASGLPGAVSGGVRVAGLAVGFVIFLGSVGQWRTPREEQGAVQMNSPREGSRSFVSSRAFWLVVAVEVVAIRGGTWLVVAAGLPDLVIVWVATVVGLHFLAFGRLFWTGFHWLGSALLTAGVVGAMVGLAGGGSGGITASTGLMAASSLYAAAGSSVVRARASAPGPDRAHKIRGLRPPKIQQASASSIPRSDTTAGGKTANDAEQISGDVRD